jgi:hypothetical protein
LFVLTFLGSLFFISFLLSGWPSTARLQSVATRWTVLTHRLILSRRSATTMLPVSFAHSLQMWYLQNIFTDKLVPTCLQLENMLCFFLPYKRCCLQNIFTDKLLLTCIQLENMLCFFLPYNNVVSKIFSLTNYYRHAFNLKICCASSFLPYCCCASPRITDHAFNLLAKKNLDPSRQRDVVRRANACGFDRDMKKER